MMGDGTMVGTWVARAAVVVVHFDRKFARPGEGRERWKVRDGGFDESDQGDAAGSSDDEDDEWRGRKFAGSLPYCR